MSLDAAPGGVRPAPAPAPRPPPQAARGPPAGAVRGRRDAPVLDPLLQAHATTTSTTSSATRNTGVLRADGDAARHRRQPDEQRIGVVEGRLSARRVNAVRSVLDDDAGATGDDTAHDLTGD